MIINKINVIITIIVVIVLRERERGGRGGEREQQHANKMILEYKSRKYNEFFITFKSDKCIPCTPITAKGARYAYRF